MSYKAFSTMILLSTFLLCASPSLHTEEPWETENINRANLKSRVTPFIWLIYFHQQILSQCDGPRSHFYPTSSEYMKHAITRHGGIGFFLGMDRLLRENNDPWLYPICRIGTTMRKYNPIF